MILSKINKLSKNSKAVAKNAAFAFIIKGAALAISFFLPPLFIKYFNNNVVLGVWYTMLSMLPWFLTSKKDFTSRIREVKFVQDNESKSCYGVLRGLHFQKPPHAQSKLVRVVKGAVLDVAVDIREGSPTFGKHVAVELTEDNHRQFLIPRGFAHGFVVLTDEVIFQYKCDNFYAPQHKGAIAWDVQT